MQEEQNKKISRRDFITVLWGLVTIFPFLYSALRFVLPPEKHFYSRSQTNTGQSQGRFELALDSFGEKTSKIINMDDEPVILLKRSSTEFLAFSAICTHLNCTVGYRKENSDFYCSCHGGRFSIDGNVIEGPPKKPLPRYIAEVSGSKLIITKPQ